ncbi:MAG: hypothetical protein AAF063_02630 [Cyanobacteria bacterium J06643_5]
MKNQNILLTNTQLQQNQITELSLLSEHELNEIAGGDKEKEGHGDLGNGQYSWYCFNIGCRSKDKECNCPPEYYDS